MRGGGAVVEERPWHPRFGDARIRAREAGLGGIGKANGWVEGSREMGAAGLSGIGAWDPKHRSRRFPVVLNQGAVWRRPQPLGRRPTRDCPGREEGARDPEGGKEGGK